MVALSRIDELDILKNLYTEVIITETVKEEFKEPLPIWITVENPEDDEKVKLLSLSLDEGESTSIALALEKENSLLIIDEKKGRKVASSLGIKLIGLMGVIIKAKQDGIIESSRDLLDKLESVDFRVSENLRKTVLKLTHE